MMSAETRRSAFSLIELLVVVATIALLAAMLLPAFARARAQARQSCCRSNLHQIGLALTIYRQDYRDWNVPIYLGPGCYWLTGVKRYVGELDVFRCPAQMPPVAFQYDPDVWNGYGMNTYNFHKPSKSFCFWYSVFDGNVTNTQVMHVADCGVYTTGTACWVGSGSSFMQPVQRVDYRHPCGFNALHYDGAVQGHEWTSQEMWDLCRD
jgi:type II secretory pathway pseudopilin PulG